MSLLQEALSKIQPIDSSLSKRVQARLDNLTKPQEASADLRSLH